jgi:hypothetical protein
MSLSPKRLVRPEKCEERCLYEKPLPGIGVSCLKEKPRDKTIPSRNSF